MLEADGGAAVDSSWCVLHPSYARPRVFTFGFGAGVEASVSSIAHPMALCACEAAAPPFHAQEGATNIDEEGVAAPSFPGEKRGATGFRVGVGALAKLDVVVMANGILERERALETVHVAGASPVHMVSFTALVAQRSPVDRPPHLGLPCHSLFWADVRPIFLVLGILRRWRFTSGGRRVRTWGWWCSSDYFGVAYGWLFLCCCGDGNLGMKGSVNFVSDDLGEQYSYAIRHGCFPCEVVALFNGAQPSTGHAKRICRILRSESWKQVGRYRDVLRIKCLALSVNESSAERNYKLHLRTAAQYTEVFWQQTRMTLGKKARRNEGGQQEVTVLEDVILPKQIKDCLDKGPKYCQEPCMNPVLKLSLIRWMGAKPEDRERCVADGVDVLQRLEGKTTRKFKTNTIVDYFLEHNLKLLTSDKEGGFVVLPEALYKTKAKEAIQKNFKPPKLGVPAGEIPGFLICSMEGLNESQVVLVASLCSHLIYAGRLQGPHFSLFLKAGASNSSLYVSQRASELVTAGLPATIDLINKHNLSGIELVIVPTDPTNIVTKASTIGEDLVKQKGPAALIVRSRAGLPVVITTALANVLMTHAATTRPLNAVTFLNNFNWTDPGRPQAGFRYFSCERWIYKHPETAPTAAIQPTLTKRARQIGLAGTSTTVEGRLDAAVLRSSAKTVCPRPAGVLNEICPRDLCEPFP
ncbi:hypothetical protein HPB47_003077 [Ixodes persulcatus]|uniref:Uncharacterized protein n=1 Tax=Ixodes persulcatus TaxID=34615 RepID=A0AC60PJH2_IXOPE|nr:hypothetical protein HPB47_003077 [Ixodes persulcatus]